MPQIETAKRDLAEKHRKQLDMLNQVSKQLQGLIGSENLYKEIVKIIQNHFHYYHMSLWTVDSEGGATLQAHDGAYEKSLQPGFRMKNEGIIGHVIKTGKSYLSNDIPHDQNFTSLNMPSETKSSLCVPVVMRDQGLKAVINIESIYSGAFGDDDLDAMTSVAAQVSLALNNALLYNEISDFNQHLKRTIQEKTQELRKAHERILQQQKLLKKENQALKTIVSKNYSDKEILGKSTVIQSLLAMIDKIAPTRVSVLIQGESGTGKELVAHRIHQRSDRADKPFVTINCASLQESLLESELFGHEKGSFTGAIAQKIGLAETADGGTLFLDEIGEVSLAIQAKLLRFIQEGEIYRVGGKTPIKVDVRVISATNRDLEQEVSRGGFREDLYYRLNTITLRVPPLRKRPEDVSLLINYFLENSKFGAHHVMNVEPRALEALQTYNWPGNVRELQNTVERLKILTEGNTISFEDLPFNIRMAKRISEGSAGGPQVVQSTKSMTLEELERNHILQMLAYQQGNKTKTAKVLGITIKTLYNKLHRYGLLGGSPDAKATESGELGGNPALDPAELAGESRPQ